MLVEDTKFILNPDWASDKAAAAQPPIMQSQSLIHSGAASVPKKGWTFIADWGSKVDLDFREGFDCWCWLWSINRIIEALARLLASNICCSSCDDKAGFSQHRLAEAKAWPRKVISHSATIKCRYRVFRISLLSPFTVICVSLCAFKYAFHLYRVH